MTEQKEACALCGRKFDSAGMLSPPESGGILVCSKCASKEARETKKKKKDRKGEGR